VIDLLIAVIVSSIGTFHRLIFFLLQFLTLVQRMTSVIRDIWLHDIYYDWYWKLEDVLYI